ncbi:hypothetical protein AXK60_09430 [Tsukamurella pseudospumae]|uniref:Uncharacterized protein n=1 Tax=Tsukamurella pseudospumae TaxID=239498 RepID=A0A138ABT0_9ACTN|nr:hypothetical protein AXK60_09430 [Tsukamurella pseudospumae]
MSVFGGIVVCGACGAVVGAWLPCVGPGSCVGCGPQVCDPSGQGRADAAGSTLVPATVPVTTSTNAAAIANST